MGIPLLLTFFLTFLTGAAAAQNQGISERRYVLPDHGTFVVQVPRGWKSRLNQPPNRLPPTIVFGPAAGRPFQMLITPMWAAALNRPPQSGESIRAQVEKAAQNAKAQAVESEIPILEIQGRSGSGFYFSATDRAPEPGEYKYVTQGILLVSELTVPFTILTNDGQERIVRQGLELIKSATHEGP